MPNAWFYYAFPLILGIGFFVAGLTVFRRFARGGRDSRGKKYGSDAGCFGILFLVVGGTLSLAIIITSPTPWERNRIFNHVLHTPPGKIERFIIEPGDAKDYRALTNSEVVIDNPTLIHQIAQSLNEAPEISPNHPKAKWTATVAIVTRNGTYYFGVYATVPDDANGTLVSPQTKRSGGGWNLGDVRADGLDKILEAAVAAAEQQKSKGE